MHALSSSNTTSGPVSQRFKKIIKDLLDKNIAALFVVAKNWKLKGCPSIVEWLNKLWYVIMMEYYCAVRNEEQDNFRKSWKDLHELMQSKISRTRRTLYTVTPIL